MNILLTHPFCRPYVRRGVERILDELSTFLVARGHTVTVLTSVPQDPGEFERDGVRILRVPQPGNRLFTRLGIPPETLFMWTCYRFVRRHRFDVVGCLYYADGLGVRFATRSRRTPYVVYITGIPVGRFLRRKPWESLIMRWSIDKAESVIVPSRAADDALMKDFGIRGSVIPPPCDLRVFRLREGRDLTAPQILAVGAFEEARKGGDALVEAFVLVAERLPRATLQFSGYVSEERKTQLLARAPMRIRERIQFLGIGRSDQLPDLYGSAAVTVLPSVGESFGMVLVESLACGTPVVGSNVGGIPDAVQKDVGVLFDPGKSRHRPWNPGGLAEAILKALDLHRQPDIYRRCRASVERFDWSRVGVMLEQEYRSAVS